MTYRPSRSVVLGLALGLSLTAAGCGGGGAASNVTAADLTSAGNLKAGGIPEGKLKGEPITYVSYGGEIQKDTVVGLEKFFSGSGAKLQQDSPPDYAKIKAMVKSKNVTWDVVDVEDFWAAANCGTLLEPLDDSLIDRSVLPEGNRGVSCGVPFVGTGNVLGYNPKKFATPPTSWKDLFDTAKFPGKRAIPNTGSPEGLLEAALLADGVPADQLYPLDVDRAFKKLDTIKKDIVFWDSGAQAQQVVESGQADLGFFWSGRLLNAANNGAKWDVIADQPILTYDYLVVPKGSKHSVAAQALINYMLGVDSQAHGAESTGYPGSNEHAQPKLTPIVEKYYTTGSAYRDPIYVDEKWWAEHGADLIDRWTTWVNG